MTATHPAPRRTRKTGPRTRQRRQLPRLGWGWAGLALAVLGAVRTWPIQAAILGVIAAATVIVYVIRPRLLNPLIQRTEHGIHQIAAHRHALPAPGRRTLATFQRMTHTHFEHCLTELARQDDRVAHAERVGGANDRGADGIVTLHDGRRILIQCKKYRDGNNVGSETIQTINGVYRDIHHCHQAVIVTTAGFTRAAYDTNARLPHGIRLIDGHALEHWANGGHAPW